jgi:hypothetical protein
MDEAVSMAKEAIGLYLESLLQHGEPIPTEQKDTGTDTEIGEKQFKCGTADGGIFILW